MKISELDFGIVKDEWYKISSGTIHIIIHVSDSNKPAFISEHFIPYYLSVKVFEMVDYSINRKNVSVHMENDVNKILNSKMCS